MSWTVYLLLGLAFCMVVGPILLLKPTPRQQALARLRARAPQLGLKVHWGKIDEEQLAVYEKSWPAEQRKQYTDCTWILERKNYVHDIHINQYWYWRDGIKPSPLVAQLLAMQLAELPAGVKAVQANSQGLGVYWDERGGEKSMDMIAGWLTRNRDALWPLSKKTPTSAQQQPAQQEDDQDDVWRT